MSPLSLIPFRKEQRGLLGQRFAQAGQSISSCLIKLFPCIFAVLTFFFCSLGSFSEGNALQPLRIGTGGSTGVYYPIGKLIASGLTVAAQDGGSPLAGIIGVAQNSAGSIDNVRALAAGEIEAALVQADVAGNAVRGERDFKDLPAAANIRVIASLYAEKFQLAVRKDAGIASFHELRGKSISVDELGSGTNATMKIVLEAHGLTENDLRPQYLKPVFTEQKMKSGELQGFAIMAGAPNTAVTKLADTGLYLLPIEPAIATAIHRQHSHLVPGKIAGGVYPGILETPTLEVYALFVVNGQMSDEVAYAVTKALFSETTLKLLAEGHPLGREIGLGSAQHGLSAPLHPGAARYYLESTRQGQ